MAVRDRMIPHNPARDQIKLPRQRASDPVFLTLVELWRLAEAAGAWRDIVLVLGFLGFRWGEMAALKVRRWDSKRRRLRIVESATEVDDVIEWTDTKTHKSRSVAVPGFIAEIIDAHVAGRGPDDLIFPASNGAPLRNGNCRRDWFDAAVQEVLPTTLVTPHDLRHTAASLAISAGANIKAVQRMLGHATASMTLDLYGHLYDDDLDSVAAALDEIAHRRAA